jgi:hypothetical protein
MISFNTLALIGRRLPLIQRPLGSESRIRYLFFVATAVSARHELANLADDCMHVRA